MNQVTSISLIVTTMLLLSACSEYNTHVVSVQQPSPVLASPLVDAPIQNLTIEDVQVIENGQAGNVDPGFVQRFTLEMYRSGLFRRVYDPTNAYNAPADSVRLKLFATELLDRHWPEKVGKDILVGLSYLALMPVMPYKMEYSVSLRVTVALPDKSTREFESSTKAEVDYKGFSDMKAAEDDLKRTAMNDCLNGLLAKMKADKDFLSALEPQ
ncbi:MAG: hypothetical protein HY268_05870 [Deltaproteobacteria bacterium]|nr:hypothetical protein [Deltaproteobacteria bacterium]